MYKINWCTYTTALLVSATPLAPLMVSSFDSFFFFDFLDFVLLRPLRKIAETLHTRNNSFFFNSFKMQEIDLLLKNWPSQTLRQRNLVSKYMEQCQSNYKLKLVVLRREWNYFFPNYQSGAISQIVLIEKFWPMYFKWDLSKKAEYFLDILM